MAVIYLETGEKLRVRQSVDQLDEIVMRVNSGPLWPFFITVTTQLSDRTMQQRVNVDKIVRYA